MTYRSLIVPAALIALGATSAVAQTPTTPAPQSPTTNQSYSPASPASARLQRLLQGITLTSEQQTRVDSVVARFAPQLQSSGSDSPPPDSARTRATLERQDSEVRNILTRDQQQVWDRNVMALRNSRP